MTDPADLPGALPPAAPQGTAHSTDPAADPAVAESETDRLAARITGPEDHVGMTALWRVTMGLPHWWFIAVGEPGAETPAAAEINGQLTLLTFTSGDRARHFAVQQQMIDAGDTLNAIAMTPAEVVDRSDQDLAAGLHGLYFDAHLSGYFIPTDQLPVVWKAVMGSEEPDPT